MIVLYLFIVPKFFWRSWGKRRNFVFKTAGLQDEMWAGDTVFWDQRRLLFLLIFP